MRKKSEFTLENMKKEWNDSSQWKKMGVVSLFVFIFGYVLFLLRQPEFDYADIQGVADWLSFLVFGCIDCKL